MRLIVFFDLPVTTRAEKKEYCRFRRFLLQEGYTMLQFSVYGRLCNGIDSLESHVKKVRNNIPSKGSIRALRITEKQYARMDFFIGEPSATEKKIGSDLTTFL